MAENILISVKGARKINPPLRSDCELPCIFAGRLAESSYKDEHFLYSCGRLDENQSKEQKGLLDSQWKNGWE